MRGKRLTVDEVKALPLRTKVVVSSSEGMWNTYRSEGVEKTSSRYGEAITISKSGKQSEINGDAQDDLHGNQYYEYTKMKLPNIKKLFNILIIFSILATPHLVLQAYARRGYFAVGGEWLVTVAILLGYAVVLSVMSMWNEAKKPRKVTTKKHLPMPVSRCR